MSLREQFDVLSNLSNYHWAINLNFDNTAKRVNSKAFENSVYRSYCRRGDRKPSSVRNKFIHFTVLGKFDYVDKLLTYHYDMRDRENPTFVQIVDVDGGTVERVNDVVLVHVNEIDITDVKSLSDSQKPLVQGKSSRLGESIYKNMCREENSYEIFTSQLNETNVMWGHHSAIDVICMNDYVLDTGHLVPNMFIHLERHTNLRGVVSYICSCKTFKLAFSHRAVEPNTKYTCSHCLYMIDFNFADPKAIG